MSPAFKASVEKLRVALLEKEFGVHGSVATSREIELLSGIVYRFIQRLTRQACEVAAIKGKFDEECLTFASRHNRRMFKRMSTLVEAEISSRVDGVADI